ncbi:unnamed protein product [Dracunculus medinensis]|uniref:Phosphoinositide phospholipase C n=1 Tax=Dracunculus medinensis TaxID=318479 RepID=A0A0N4U9P9_DRAME|nr:unnamed protein product [Dracunculus medinensis]
MDTSRSAFLTPSMIKEFLAVHQMEFIDKDYAIKIIQEHEPDSTFRGKYQLSFEGFVRYLNDPVNFAFVPEEIKPDNSSLHYPLSYYYICSSHNTYLTGHQLKGESSAEMYRQVLLTGCRCVELDCWDGDDGLPQIFHGHTFTSKISFRQVIEVIKKSAFVASSMPVILSIENHCSLQQQARMAQMFKNHLGEKLVTNFLFEVDYSDRPRLPSPWQLQNRILIKNKKMVSEPSFGLSLDKNIFHDNEHYLNDEGEDDDLDEFLDEDGPDDIDCDEKCDTDSVKLNDRSLKTTLSFRDIIFESSDIQKNNPTQASVTMPYGSKNDDDSTPDRASGATAKLVARKQVAGPLVAPELSDLVNYLQSIKFKLQNLQGFPQSLSGPFRRSHMDDPYSGPKIRSSSNLLIMGTPPRRLRNATLIRHDASSRTADGGVNVLTSLRPKSNASCYQVVSLNEAAARKLCRKHALKCIAYTRSHIMRTYPGGIRIDSSNFNPIQYWAFGLQMIALNFQTPDVSMAINTAMFESSGNCGYALKPRLFWDDTHPLYRKYNPISKDFASLSALILTLQVISGQHVCFNQHNISTHVEVEIFGISVDCAKEKSKVANRNSVNPIWNFLCTFKIKFVDLAFLKIAICDSANGRCVSQRVVPVRHLRPGYRHLPLRNSVNLQVDNATIFIHSRFEQEEHVYLYDDDETTMYNIDQQLAYQTIKDDQIKPVPMLKRQVFVLRVLGLLADDGAVIVHAELNTTVRSVIQMALVNAGKSSDNADDYLLIEESAPRSLLSSADDGESIFDAFGSRILPYNEFIMDAVACWDGSTKRFIVKRKGNDPGSRAWITSIIKSTAGSASPSSSTYERKSDNARYKNLQGTSSSHGRLMSVDSQRLVEMVTISDNQSHQHARSIGDTFLVCVHNVCDNQPYVILRANISSTANDIIRKVFIKSHCVEANEADYVLVEETADNDGFDQQFHQDTADSIKFARKKTPQTSKSIPSKINIKARVLQSDENVWKVQNGWVAAGRFVLENRKETVHSALEKIRNFLEALENARAFIGDPEQTFKKFI